MQAKPIVTINWTPAKLVELESMYTETIAARKDSFMFEDQIILTGYAKYLIEYLRSNLK